MFNSLNFILLTYLAKLSSLNLYLLLNYSIFSLFLKAVSAQNSYFSLSAFREFIYIKLHLIFCFNVYLLLLSLRDYLQVC